MKMEYKDFFNNADNPGNEAGTDRTPDGYAQQQSAEAQSAEWQGVEAQSVEAQSAEWQGAGSDWAAPDQAQTPTGPERPRVYGNVNGQAYYGASGAYYQQGDAPPSGPTPSPYADPSSVFGAKRADEPGQDGAGASYMYADNPSHSGGSGAPPAGAAAAAASTGSSNAPPLDGRRFSILIVVIIIAMLASGITGGIIGSNIRGNATPPSVVGAAGSEDINILANSDLNTTEAVAQKVLDSVVGITSTMTVEGGSYFGFDLGSQESGGVGTGIIVDASGYILTNSHVVLDGAAEKIEVLLSDGSTVPGNLLWNDSSVDLAILKADATGKTLKPAELGDSDKVRIGSYVAAIGNPLGLDFNGSVTQGVVSGLGRSITASDGTKSTTMEGLIQVDAAINSGNSGGPLLDKQGQVIGVNTAKAQAEGMGFAIPINTAKPIVDKVIKTGGFERVYMGVSAADASVIAEQYPDLGIATDEKGAFITAISGDSPADNAGLKMKDIITAVNDKAIESSADLIKTLLNYSAGDTVKVTYKRDGVAASVDVILANQADVYGEWNNGNAGTENGGGSGQSPLNPGSGSGESPADPFGGGGDPFGDW
ncbi:MAG: S1C family serine protease [Clostridiales Family XIII bacterium]|jgi:S1-C subfamily serine protease|nr:S1C family serine protease [Clostridiales Family XIII bacterium]